MANKKHVALLQKSVAAWNAWREKNPDTRPHLHNTDLNGADLRGADLSGVNLYAANLSGADLVGRTSAGRASDV